MNRLRCCLQNSVRVSWFSKNKSVKTPPDELSDQLPERTVIQLKCCILFEFQDVMHFRAMANVKSQSSLTQQQGMQVSLSQFSHCEHLTYPSLVFFMLTPFQCNSNPQAVDLTKLNLMQLTQFKNGLDSDLQFYQESLQNLKMAQSK